MAAHASPLFDPFGVISERWGAFRPC